MDFWPGNSFPSVNFLNQPVCVSVETPNAVLPSNPSCGGCRDRPFHSLLFPYTLNKSQRAADMIFICHFPCESPKTGNLARRGCNLARRGCDLARRGVAVKLIPELVQHVNAGLVLGHPEDELCGLGGRENAL